MVDAMISLFFYFSFFLPTTSIGGVYNLQDAFYFTRLAALSYCPSSALLHWQCTHCQEWAPNIAQVTIHTSGSNFALIAFIPSKNQVVAIFHADLTTSFLHLIDFRTKRYPGCSKMRDYLNCTVHKYTYQQFNTIESPTMTSIQATLTAHPQSTLVLVGHGMGGNFALLTAANLLSQNKSIALIYTLGSMRLGDSKFRSWFMSNYGQYHEIYRLVHRADNQPHFPLAKHSFIHLPREIFYNSPKQDPKFFSQCNDQTQEDPQCSLSYALTALKASDHLLYLTVNFTDVKNNCK